MNFAAPTLSSRLPAESGAKGVRTYQLILKAILAGTLVASPFWLAALFFSSPVAYPYFASLIWVPLLGVFCAWMFTVVCRQDRFLKLLFATGVLAKMACSGIFLWLGFHVFGTVDAIGYWLSGLELANTFDAIGWAAFAPPYWSSNLIRNIAGVMTLATGDALPVLFVFFALMAVWGGYLFYRAFCISFPDGDRRTYAMLVVFLPSTLFWSAAIGKDALEQLSIGLAAYGFAGFMKKYELRAGLVCFVGVLASALVRPHIGATLALACFVPFVFAGTGGGKVRALAKMLLVPLLLAATIYMLIVAGNFVGLESSDLQGGLDTVGRLAQNTQTGDSAFSAPLPVRLAMFPFLIFRPFPWEIHNATALVAAVEGLALFVFCWKRRLNFRAVLRHWRNPFIAFILIFFVEFSLAFSAANSNLGILVRERIMLLPLILMLFCTNLSQSEPVDAKMPTKAASWDRRSPAFRERYVTGLAKRTES